MSGASIIRPHSCKKESSTAHIVVFNKNEWIVVERILKRLKTYAPAILTGVTQNIETLEQVALAISQYPSIKKKTTLIDETRSTQTLIKTLCSGDSDSRLLALPAKVVLGKSFLIAKFQTFAALTKIAMNAFFEEEEIAALRQLTVQVMFALMAEDVYVNLLDKEALVYQIRAEIAQSLIELWEKRFDDRMSLFAPVLHKVWTARNKIAPNFGTMLGVSELFLLSMELDESWEKFMITHLDNGEMKLALEEFLFGIPYEKISFIRCFLKDKKISALSRDEVYELLGLKTDFILDDARVFYSSFIERKNNAEARRRLQVEGPKRTLEDMYIQFIFEQRHQKSSKQ